MKQVQKNEKILKNYANFFSHALQENKKHAQ